MISIVFLANTFGPMPLAQAQEDTRLLAQQREYLLPAPGVMVHLSPPFAPPILKGIKVHPDNPFHFEFILDKGDSIQSNDQLKDDSVKLIKYFLASLTIPENDLWVNLSPYEKDRIIPPSFGLTEMGRDLLAEDYMLKQITASLIYPEDAIGKKFWGRIYEEAAKKFGTTNIPVNTFNKVWIVPEKAVVYENAQAGTAYVVESKLKVMLEQDYLSLEKHEKNMSFPNASVGNPDLAQTIDPRQKHSGVTDVSSLGSQIVREIVIPELTREVNEDKNFASLRQVYNSLILATWYKKKIKDSILNLVYTNRSKVAGVNIDDPQEKQKIYEKYLQAYKKGVYNYIKEERDILSQQMIPRKYFSGGEVFIARFLNRAMITTDTFDAATMTPPQVPHNFIEVDANVGIPVQSAQSDAAMTSAIQNRLKGASKYLKKPLFALKYDWGGAQEIVLADELVEKKLKFEYFIGKSKDEVRKIISREWERMQEDKYVVRITEENLLDILSDPWQERHARNVMAYFTDESISLPSEFPSNDPRFVREVKAGIKPAKKMALIIGINQGYELSNMKELANAQEESFDTVSTKTGLPSELAFQRWFFRMVQYSDRRPGTRVGVGMFDLDYFKAVNSLFKQTGGDQVIAQIGMSLSRGRRPLDITSHISGDEFMEGMYFDESVSVKQLQLRYNKLLKRVNIEVNEKLKEMLGNREHILGEIIKIREGTDPNAKNQVKDALIYQLALQNSTTPGQFAACLKSLNSEIKDLEGAVEVVEGRKIYRKQYKLDRWVVSITGGFNILSRSYIEDIGHQFADLAKEYLETNPEADPLTDLRFIEPYIDVKNAVNGGLKTGKNNRNHTVVTDLESSVDGAQLSQNKIAADYALTTPEKNGGIDLTPANMNLQTKVMDSRFRGNDSRAGIRFHIDPAQLARLQNAPGFEPVVTRMQTVTDIRQFLGVNETRASISG